MEQESNSHPNVLVQDNPQFLKDAYDTVTGVFINYGWFLLAFSVISVFIWKKYLSSQVAQYRENLAEAEYSARYHKNPDISRELNERMQEARKRMQNENDLKAAEHAKKLAEKEEERRIQKEKERERLGYASGNKLGSSSGKKSLKEEYNPLAGDSSRGYRPAKKSCPGGGCNK